MGDFNTGFEGNNDFLQFYRKTKLVDVNYKRYKTQEFATYVQGKSRIDFYLVAESILLDIENLGYMTFADIFQSDHRGQFLPNREKCFCFYIIKFAQLIGSFRQQDQEFQHNI